MRVFLVTPPMTQLNTPYPATAYLTGFLRKQGHEVFQADFSLELALRLFSKAGLTRVLSVLDMDSEAAAGIHVSRKSRTVRFFRRMAKDYLRTVDPVIRFLQGKDPALAHRICQDGFLPQGPRFDVLSELQGSASIDGSQDALGWAFGSLGLQDRAKHLASLYLDDLADLVRDGIDPRFELSKYGEKLAASAASFDPLLADLKRTPTLIDELLDTLTEERISTLRPDFVGLTVPFPGNVYGAFRIAQKIRSMNPNLPIAMGGGYANTELRELGDPRVFDFIDFIPLDDGQMPLVSILENVEGTRPRAKLFRTFTREMDASSGHAQVVLHQSAGEHDIPFDRSDTPSYEGLPLTDYLSVCELLNPMHRLWSDGRWNKLTVAHGCYWKRCSFCDITLDYIGRYEPQTGAQLVDRIERVIAETGNSGFHFVDEAAPPKVLAAMAKELLARNLTITWWANIRFEKTFTPELASLLAASGCVAISGGLEVASDRLLKKMEKGVTVDQVVEVTHALTRAGILVHAYLMYGFPGQTLQETIDALERVRQLFQADCIQSAYWHRFSATVHSPVGKNPSAFGIEILPTNAEGRPPFARNDLEFVDSTGIDHGAFSPGLRKALYNFMHGVGLEEDVRNWFDFVMPRPKVAKAWIDKVLQGQKDQRARS